MIAATGPFPRTERIRRSREFREIARRGQRRCGEAFVVLSAPSAAQPARARLGLTVSRRVGNAVVRNRVKRRIREWFRRVGREIAHGRDLVVIARRGAAQHDGTQSFTELSELAGGGRPTERCR